MSEICAAIHSLVRRGTQHGIPFDVSALPLNGIYVLFERGEDCHGGARIVRVGTHTGDGQLPSRLLAALREGEQRPKHFPKEHWVSLAESGAGRLLARVGT